MTATKGYYAAIQVTPDPSRLETVNVGALLFCPDQQFLDVRFAPDFRRARKLFEKLDETLLDMQRQALVDRLRPDDFQTKEDLQDFIDRRAGVLRFSIVRPLQVASPQQELDDLFEKLVGFDVPRRKRGPRAKTLFEKALAKEHLIERIRRPLKIDLPSIGKVLEADYGYKNGRFNVIDPVDFTTEEGWFKAASARAIEGQALRHADHPDFGPMNLVVVGRFAKETERHSAAVGEILSRHDVRLYDLERMGPLISDIRKHVRPTADDAA